MIDQKVIDLHQWIVDESERTPAWWAEQTAYAFVAAEVAAYAFTWSGGWDFVLLLISLVFGTSMVIVARTPALLASSKFSSSGWRKIFLASVAIMLLTLVNKPEVGKLAHFLGTVIMTSYHYFAACQPPRPRKRRQAVAQGGAA